MKFITFLIFLFYLNSNALADNLITINAICRSFDYNQIAKGLTKLSKQPASKNKLGWGVLVKRKVISGFEQKIIGISLERQVDSSPGAFAFEEFHIHFLLKKNRICYYRITKKQYKECNDVYTVYEAMQYQDSTLEINSLKSKYFNLYGQKINLDDICKTNIIFSRTCGYGFKLSEQRIALIEKINQKDINYFLAELKCGQTERQLYAIEGLLTLKKNGLILDKNTLSLIKYISKRKGKAQYCSGCSTFNRRIKSLAREIKRRL